MTTASFDFQLPGYREIDRLYCDANTIVYQAKPTGLGMDADDLTVVIKLLLSAYPTDRELLDFRHQYTIAKNIDLPGVVRVYSLQEFEVPEERLGQRGYALVMENFGGVALSEYAKHCALPCIDVLDIAIQLADTLHALGQQRIVHKDIKPANILINPTTKQVKLTNFSIASLLPRETQTVLNLNRLEGTLAYISPEQTGRMNRGIDYRTDFYTLGVTLYQLLTGKLPFEAEDSIELIHCHLAQIAAPVHLVNPDVPLVVSQIIAKLMAKNAEDRYQSAIGLKYDLNECLQQLERTGAISELTIGQRDWSDRFIIPEQLYGRELEVQTLLDAYDRIVRGGSKLMLVAGASGIGKTVVIKEIHKPITRQQGYFIEGKFDRLNRNIPLSAIVAAFRNLIGQILSENDARIATWKEKILTAVGTNGQAIVEAIPELELIIGQQPPLPELSGSATQNRFNLLFQNFIKVFTTPEQPLVMFLDDLQWADLASLQLLKQLLRQDISHLLILGAYRDNEVDSAHPLMLTIEELNKQHVSLQTIALQPLSQQDVNQLVADTLNCDLALAKPLTKLIDRKTQGNPFFTTQFLKALHQDGFIHFAYPIDGSSRGGWQCDLSQIELQSLTDDVVKFMAQQLQKLAPSTQEMLALAAFIGTQFDLQTLALVADRSELATATALWQALQTGLILPLDRLYKFFQPTAPSSSADDPTPLRGGAGEDALNLSQYGVVGGRFITGGEYRFLHDRVQQAAYSLTAAAATAAVHLQIGRLLRDRAATPEQFDSQLFQIVNQLDRGVALITDPIEREELAQLNWRAGNKARTSAAYDAAMSYLNTGLQLLAPQSWQHQYDLSLRIHQLAVEVAYLLGDYDRMTELMEMGLQQAKNHLDRAKLHETQILALVAQNQSRAAVNYACNILPNYGVRLPQHPSPLRTTWGFLYTIYQMAGKQPQALLALPAMSDPYKLAGYSLINTIGAAAQRGMPEMLPFITFTGISLSLKYGNIPKSSMGYIIYAFLLCEKLGRIDTGYAMGKAAIALCHQTAAKEALGATLFLWNRFIAYRKESLHLGLPLLLEAYQVSLEVGDTEYAAYSFCTYWGQKYEIGVNLMDLCPEAVSHRGTFEKLQQQSITNIHNLLCQCLENLTSANEDVCRLVGRFFDEREIPADDIQLQAYIGVRKLELAILFDRYEVAKEQISIVEQRIGTIDGTFNKSTICFNEAIVRLAEYPLVSKHRQKNHLKQIAKARKYLDKLAKSAPLNYQHKALLITAELLRIQGKSILAGEYYDRAISAAKTSGYIQEEAYISECAAKFYQSCGKAKIAAIYMQEAYYCYARWGAKVKTDDLEKRYPQLLEPILQRSRSPEFDPLTTLATITNSAANNYNSSPDLNTFDLASVIQSAQTLTSTLQLEELIQQLLQIILKNSGAETGMLALPNGDEWQIQAIATVNPSSATADRSAQPIADNLEYPEKLIYWIKNTKQVLVFDARKPPATIDSTAAFINDRYLLEHQPQSVFVLPILKQDRVLGVVYLEHRHTPDLFTDSKIMAISFLCSQAAIALENANLYQASRQAQSDLATSRQKYYDLIQSSNGVVWEYDLVTDRFSFVSDRSFALLGYPISDWLSQPNFWCSCVHPDDRDLVVNIYSQAIERRQRCEAEYRMITADGRVIWVYDISTPTCDLDGKPIATNGLLIDISDRKQVEIQLQETNERLAATNAELIRATQLKDEFLATMSHELRTPLNAILGMSEILQGEVFGSVNKRQLKSLLAIDSSGRHLLSLINDVLDFSKIEARKLDLDISTVYVLQLCNSSLAFVKQQAASKQIGLDLQLPPLPGKIAVDERRMRQVLINLLSNAVKFTPKGGWIELCVTKSADDDWIEFAVIDTGIGIASADRHKLFKPFVQLDSSLNRQYEGTGLGLTLAKQIVELHGGSISIESEVGQGSCFIVRLPQSCLVADSDSGALDPFDRSDGLLEPSDGELAPSSLILLAEDNQANINVLSIFLTAKGYRTILAHNGHEAIELAQRDRPDLILMDIQMPGMDGLEAIVWMRQHPQLAKIPIVALTSLAMNGDRDRCLAAGANDYLAKPIPLKQLHLKIQELLGGRV